MWKYDICISCCPEDRAQAETLAESLRAYRLPSNVIIRDPQLDYRKIALESDGLPLDDTVRALYQDSRLLLMLCSPATGSSAAIRNRNCNGVRGSLKGYFYRCVPGTHCKFINAGL